MNKDKLKICSRCGSDACYETSIKKGIDLRLCYGCGFQCNTLMKSEPEFLKLQLDILPELHKDLMYTDKEGDIWFPSAIREDSKGMVFADGGNIEDWKWAAVKATDIKKEEEDKYIGKDGKVKAKKMDMTSMKHFEQFDYMEALSYIGVLPE